MAYEAHKAMFEAYGRNKYTSTGVIQWMLNNAFPDMIWHLYDYYFNPSSTYFATKRACEPIHIQYSYTDNSIWVVNSQYSDQNNLQANIMVYNLDGSHVYEKSGISVKIPADGTLKIFDLPDLSSLSSTYFLRLNLTDTNNEVVSSNTYWLSTSKDVLEWNKSNWFRTPCKSYADFTLLQSLPQVQLQVKYSSSVQGDFNVTMVTVTNPSTSIAFFVHVTIQNNSGTEIWPIYYDDNYFTLFPSESRIITAKYHYLDNTKAVVDLWNDISRL